MIKESTILLNVYFFFDLIQDIFEEGTLVVFWKQFEISVNKNF